MRKSRVSCAIPNPILTFKRSAIDLASSAVIEYVTRFANSGTSADSDEDGSDESDEDVRFLLSIVSFRRVS